MSDPSPGLGTELPRVIAVVSGKGGSGKTMIAAEMARVLDMVGHPVLVVDADTGTAGMTYYLGMELVRNIAVGLSDVIRAGAQPAADPFERALQPIRNFRNAQFFGVGDHRRLYREAHDAELPGILSKAVDALRRKERWMIVDCRGGIDSESVAVCRACDDILMVVEPDTTSFQASQHVVDILTANDLAHKLRGFIINKVFEDPRVVARSGTSVFRSQYLASVPFDLDATRAFLVGDVPAAFSPFGIHVWQALHKAYAHLPEPPGRVWTFADFREVGLTNLDSLRGGLAISACIALAGVMWAINTFSVRVYPPEASTPILVVALTLGVLAGVEPFRRVVGRAFTFYVRTFSRLLVRRAMN